MAGGSPVTLLDFKAGFQDSARGTITSLDWAIVTVDPTRASLEMAAAMRDLVAQMKAGALPATRHLERPEAVALANRLFAEAPIKAVEFVLSRVPNDGVEAYLRQSLAERGIEPIGTLREAPAVSMAWLKGRPVTSRLLAGSAAGVVAALEAKEDLARLIPAPAAGD